MAGKKKVVRVSYTPILAAPRRRKCEKVATEMARQGWTLVSWKEREGLFGFGAHTELKFLRVGAGAATTGCAVILAALGLTVGGVAWLISLA